MKTILLCLIGSTQIIPSVKNSQVIEGDYETIESFLLDDTYNGKQVIIVGAGSNSYYTAKLASDFQKKCYINGHPFEFRKNADDRATHFESLLLLASQCDQETLFKECAKQLIHEAVKQTPRNFGHRQMKEILASYAPALKLKNKQSAVRYILKSFRLKMNERKAANRKRLMATPDGKTIIEKKMNYKDVAEYIHNNPGLYAATARMGGSKTEDIVKPLFEKLSKGDSKALLMTSTVSLTNSLCSDHRNYKEALRNGTIKDQTAIASCLYSALLSPSFSKHREESDFAIIEEYESCRDAIPADIVGKFGSLEEKATAQTNFNKILNKETVLITDAHFSQQSADHIIKRTGRPIIVIKPLFEPKRKAKKLTYHANKNNAIQAIRDTLHDDKRGLTFDDSKHQGSESKFKATNIQITEGLDIKSTAIDAAFFAKGDNIKHMQNPTEFVSEYQHVISTSVWRNGVSMFSNFDLLTMLCHQTIAPLDVLQWAERDRLNTNKSIFIGNKNAPQVSWYTLFDRELTKGILAEDVDEKRKLLQGNEAVQDIIDRIKYNNEIRLDYANNLLCMFELLGYEITYDYSSATKEMMKKEKSASKEEKEERLSVYKSLDRMKQSEELSLINAKSEDIQTLDEKRLSYADEVFSFYRIDNKTEDKLFKQTFNFDKGGYGRLKIENLFLVTSTIKSNYYTSTGKKAIFKKLFECLEIDNELNGQFSKRNYDKFFDFVKNGEIEIGGKMVHANYVFLSLIPDVKITTSAWVVKGLLNKEFGLDIARVEIEVENKDGTITKSNPCVKNTNEQLMTITKKSSEKLLKFCKMADPTFNSVVEEEVMEHCEFTSKFELEEVNSIVQDYDKDSDNDAEECSYELYIDSIEKGIELLDEAS
ncbi:hypothetical protein NBRC116592_03590 [Colwellia sp. KU-HH00111]|uniref:hypothetical protein n=1 Tax=Colwellia sp. KU-HH00111 TaxID=3127652 RepID=UPI00310730A5